MWEINHIDEENCIHVVPLGDIKRHLVSRKCPCGPYTKNKEWQIWLHPSYDLREVAEEEIDVESILYEEKKY